MLSFSCTVIPPELEHTHRVHAILEKKSDIVVDERFLNFLEKVKKSWQEVDQLGSPSMVKQASIEVKVASYSCQQEP